MNTKKRILILALVLLICLTGGFIGYKNSKSGITSYMLHHAPEMTAYAQELLESDDSGAKQKYNNWQVTCDPARGQVEFLTSGYGINAKGLYYSASDEPMGAQGTDITLEPQGNGYIWHQEDGDHWQYSERITSHWFWFEAHA